MSMQSPEVQALKRENEQLRDKLTVFEESVGVTMRAPRALKLTKMEERIFCAVYQKGFIRRDAVMAAMYGPDMYDRCRECLDVLLMKVRKKCRPHGLEISAVYARGFEMPEASRRIVKAMYEAEQRGAA
jgi:SOS response regulatory protein OraA/RecX